MMAPFESRGAQDPDRFAQRLAALSPAKRAFLEQQLQRGQNRNGADIIPRRDDGVNAPLSFSQETLWHIERTARSLSTYNVSRAMRIVGPLDAACLHAALDALVERHAALRTVFVVQDGEPIQTVRPAQRVALRYIDLPNANVEDRESEVSRALHDAAIEPFDLACDQLLRGTLVRVRNEEHALVLVWHHVASDEGSVRILFRDLATLYGAIKRKEPDGLPQLEVRYTDFAAWQRETWTGARLDQLLEYWEKQLAKTPATLELPTDRPRPGLPSFDGHMRSRLLGPHIATRVKDLALAKGVTPFVMLLAAFQTYLYRYSGQNDVLVGTVFSGRGRPQLANVVGYFSNVLPLRMRFMPEASFSDVLADVRECYLDAADRIEVPLETVVLNLLERSKMEVVPTIRVLFTLAADAPAVPSLPGLSLSPIPMDRNVSRVDLMVAPEVSDDGLRLSIEYRTQLFDASTIERMFDCFEVLLRGILDDPSTAVCSLPLLPEAQRRALLIEPNTTAAVYPERATLHELFGVQAVRTPNAIAVEGADSTGVMVRLTYAELDARAEELAASLRGHGVAAGVGVGIFAERSAGHIVAILGVLKAGGYYVPLNTAYPDERLRFMISDASIKALVVEKSVLEKRGLLVGSVDDPVVVQLDQNGQIGASDSQDREAAAKAPAGPDDLAYVMYTSGSTGTPKGVMIPHRAVVNVVTWMHSAYPLGADGAVFQQSAPGFDVSVGEIFVPLLTGARLVLAPPSEYVDPFEFIRCVQRQRVSDLHVVPSKLQMIVDATGEEGWKVLAGLDRLFMSGEELQPQLLDRILAACPRVVVVNLYGPTETTVWCTYWTVDRLSRKPGDPVSLGRPISNMRVYAFDAQRQPVPIGVAGELWVGGTGLARGYLGRPDLTAQQFAVVPGRDLEHERLYRTGDLVRYHADGTLEFLGRLDTQVKLRGNRVELGEIEARLSALREVESAVVVLRGDRDDQLLVAYCVASAVVPPSDWPNLGADLRRRLKATLPEYMIPGHIVWLDVWPLNANGKLDRAALAAREVLPPRSAAGIAPRTETELALAGIWAHVLKRDVIGADDNFFDVGGHSLFAMRIVSRVQDVFRVRIPLRAMFESSTLAELAAVIDDSMRSRVVSKSEPTIVPVARKPYRHGDPNQSPVVAE